MGRSAGRRFGATLSTSATRTAIAAPLVALLGYNALRAGLQVLGGLDPDFTANAWGGPGYAGAMACHYLDLALLSAAAGWLLDRVLVRPTRQNGAVGSTRLPLGDLPG